MPARAVFAAGCSGTPASDEHARRFGRVACAAGVARLHRARAGAAHGGLDPPALRAAPRAADPLRQHPLRRRALRPERVAPRQVATATRDRGGPDLRRGLRRARRRRLARRAAAPRAGGRVRRPSSAVRRPLRRHSQGVRRPTAGLSGSAAVRRPDVEARERDPRPGRRAGVVPPRQPLLHVPRPPERVRHLAAARDEQDAAAGASRSRSSATTIATGLPRFSTGAGRGSACTSAPR